MFSRKSIQAVSGLIDFDAVPTSLRVAGSVRRVLLFESGLGSSRRD